MYDVSEEIMVGEELSLDDTAAWRHRYHCFLGLLLVGVGDDLGSGLVVDVTIGMRLDVLNYLLMYLIVELLVLGITIYWGEVYLWSLDHRYYG